jgi:hypothetical protein
LGFWETSIVDFTHTHRINNGKSRSDHEVVQNKNFQTTFFKVGARILLEQ